MRFSTSWLGFVIFGACLVSTASTSMAEETPAEADLSVRSQFTFGVMGASRPSKFLPEETIYVRNEVQGVTIDPKTRQCSLTLDFTVQDSDRTEIKRMTQHEKKQLPMGGGYFTGALFFKIPELRKGSYILEIRVQDNLSKATAKIDLPFEVAAIDAFGAKNVLLTQDRQKRIFTNSYCSTGESIYLHADIVNYEARENQVDLMFEIKLVDEAGTTIVEKSYTEQRQPPQSRFGEAKVAYTLNAEVFTSRPGKFHIVLIAHDLLAGTYDQVQVPLFVSDPFQDFAAP
ncbi:hypothetical protein [Bremerella cremea]|uniref:hypothetical protein n=1 Tax=Bremerella cremea TaxID=1031537 RepID=UPI0031EEBB3C